MNRENAKPFAHSKHYLYFWQKYSDQMNENVLAKLKILAESAKYDVSCSSSGTVRRNQSGALGNTVGGWGICHSFAEDGRCISLLKIMLTNYCIYDCAYCINRRSNDIPRATLSVSELVDLTIEFYRRNYIEGLFLSSGVVRNPDYTMERLVRVAKDLRLVHKFNGYIHLKSIPGASRELVNEAGLYADRLSVNIEIPKEENLKLLAPEKITKVYTNPCAISSREYLPTKKTEKIPPYSTLRSCRTKYADDCRCHNRIRQRHPLSFFFTLPTPHHEARLLLWIYIRKYIRQTASGTETAAIGT